MSTQNQKAPEGRAGRGGSEYPAPPPPATKVQAYKRPKSRYHHQVMTKLFKILRWPAVIGGLVVAVAGGVLALNPQWVKVEGVDIELVEGSKEELLFQRIKTTLAHEFQKYNGRYFWQVPLTEVYEITAHDKRVKSAEIFREFPSRLKVRLEPHTPMLAYLSADGRLYPVATDATLLPALPVADATDLPILRGEDLKDEPRLRELALELFARIPQKGILRQRAVSEIVYTRKDGFKIFVSGQTGEVKIGDSDFGPKVSRVERVLNYLDSRGVKGRVIDARFSKKVVVRVRNNP